MKKFLLSLLVLAACSGDDSKPSDPFIGTWAYTTGTGSFSCDDGEAGELVLNPGANGTFEYTSNAFTFSANAGCTYELEMVEDVAVPVVGATCVVHKYHPQYGNYTVTTTFTREATSWTIDGLGHLHETLAQHVVQFYPEYNNFTLNCDSTSHATAERGTP
jgi:hypothetical protein